MEGARDGDGMRSQGNIWGEWTWLCLILQMISLTRKRMGSLAWWNSQDNLKWPAGRGGLGEVHILLLIYLVCLSGEGEDIFLIFLVCSVEVALCLCVVSLYLFCSLSLITCCIFFRPGCFSILKALFPSTGILYVSRTAVIRYLDGQLKDPFETIFTSRP